MDKATRVIHAVQPNVSFGSALEQVLREGSREMLLKAIENEVADYINRHIHLRDADGKRLVVRNGHSGAGDTYRSWPHRAAPAQSERPASRREVHQQSCRRS